MKKIAIIAALFLLTVVNANASKAIVLPRPVKRLAADENTKIQLTLGNKIYELQNYNVNYFYVSPDDKAKTDPVQNFYNQTNVVMVGIRTSKVDQELLDWVFTSDKTAKSGQIAVIDADTGKVIKTIVFTELVGSGFTEFNAANNNSQSVYSFSLRFKTISIKL